MSDERFPENTLYFTAVRVHGNAFPAWYSMCYTFEQALVSARAMALKLGYSQPSTWEVQYIGSTAAIYKAKCEIDDCLYTIRPITTNQEGKDYPW